MYRGESQLVMEIQQKQDHFSELLDSDDTLAVRTISQLVPTMIEKYDVRPILRQSFFTSNMVYITISRRLAKRSGKSSTSQ